MGARSEASSLNPLLRHKLRVDSIPSKRHGAVTSTSAASHSQTQLVPRSWQSQLAKWPRDISARIYRPFGADRQPQDLCDAAIAALRNIYVTVGYRCEILICYERCNRVGLPLNSNQVCKRVSEIAYNMGAEGRIRANWYNIQMMIGG